MMGIGVSVSVGSVAQTVVTSVSQTVTIDSVVGIGRGLSSGGGLSLSRPLAVVGVSMMSIGVSVGSVAQSMVTSVSQTIGTIGTIGVPWVSLSFRLGLWLTGDEGGKANHKSELHCCLSVQSRIPM